MDTYKVAKFFNTAGPGKETINYMIDPLRRIDYDEIISLIDQQRYFVLHAPRQTGKTTSLLAMAKRINDDGRYHCVYINVEPAQAARNDAVQGMTIIMSRFDSATRQFSNQFTLFAHNEPNEIVSKKSFGAALSFALQDLCEAIDKPLVLMIDEIDSLIGDTLISVLRQLREGYANRPKSFPISVILCGVRDVRDYRIHMSNGDIITGGSCFNIKAESLRIGDFSQEEIRELYEQHTAETGQVFEEEIYPKVWSLTHGQPWLVNALALQVTWRMRENRDRSRHITLDILEEAANALILECATHLDQLTDKLREERVRRVLAPMLSGESWADNEELINDDVQYLVDLGLIRFEGVENGRRAIISNDIYKEIIPRELTFITQQNFAATQKQAWYLSPDGSLDIPKLLRAFQQFFRENSESWLERFDYKEAGFQLLLQAFLQRIVNGGGTIDREYALGRGRVDLCVRWRYSKEQRIVIELKTIRAASKNAHKVLPKGLEQTARYTSQCGADEAHLIICDERHGKTWDAKIYERIEAYNGQSIHIWGV
ncbi:ATP-binding protein [Breznakiellaceae bacterium SP9]